MSNKRLKVSGAVELSRNGGRESYDDHDGPDAFHSQWNLTEARVFFEAYRASGSDWEQVADKVQSKSPQACEAFAKNFRSLLSLPTQLLTVTAFLAVVQDTLKIKQSASDGPKPSEQQSQETVTDTEKDTSTSAAPRRSARTPRSKKVKAVDFNKSPVWGSRKPRRQSMRAPAVSGVGFLGNDEDAEDAEGVAALMSLATGEPHPPAVLREEPDQEEDQDDDDDYAAAHSFHREPSESSDDAYDYVSPRKRRNTGRRKRAPTRRRAASKAERDMEPPRSRRRQESQSGKSAIEPDDDEETSNRLSTRKAKGATLESPPKSTSKRGRKRAAQADPRAQEPEQSGLDAGAEKEEENRRWPVKEKHKVVIRRRRRKPRPERAPQMMASASVIFARRNSLAFGAPPAAFLIGVPPPSAQWCGIETEGQDHMGPVEIQLRNCLDTRVRRWCQAEFFCSSIDRPWFLKNELAEYLEHVGLAKGAKLARPELCIIRSSLGQPRRLSLNFLREERLKLEAWREHVRETYKDLGAGAELPPDIPKQLQVGHRVTARHPVTRQLHDGDVLTVSHNSYLIQFLRRELGVEMVKDVDVMPVDPPECLPAAFLWSQPNVVMNGRQAGRGRDSGARWQEGSTSLDPSKAPPARGLPYPANPAAAPAPAPRPQGSIRTVDDLKVALDTKEALLSKIRRLNDEVELGMHKDPAGQRTPTFQKMYSAILSDLHKLNLLLEASPFARPSLGSMPLPQHAPAPRPSLPPQLPMAQVGPGLVTPQQPLIPIVRPSYQVGTNAASAWDAIWRATQATLTKAKQQTLAQSRAESAEAGQSAPAQGETSQGGAAAPKHGGIQDGIPKEIAPMIPQSALDTRIAGCVSLLHTLHQCSERPQALSLVQRHTEKALALLRPRSRKNLETYNIIENRANRLQAHLSKARASYELPATSGLALEPPVPG